MRLREIRMMVGITVSALFLALVFGQVSASAGGAVVASERAVKTTAPSAGCRSGLISVVPTGGNVEDRSLLMPTLSASYLLATPPDLSVRRPAPLVLLFHGFGSNPSQFSSLTGMPHEGARAGDVVAVPHLLPGETEWQFSGTGTDGNYVHTLINSLESSLCINKNAVFVTGFSAGAAFTIFYSCTHQSEIRAIATVAVDFQLGCQQPMPILAFHGTKDPEVPYQNGAVGLSLPGIKVRGTQLNMGDWARLDKCQRRPAKKVIGKQVLRQMWSGCAQASQVDLFTILAGGHTWPGASPAKGVGLTTQEINATSEILRFFSSYSSSAHG